MKLSPLFAFLMALYLFLPCIFARDPDPPDQRKLRGGSHVDVYEGRYGSQEEARGGSDMDKGRHGSYKEARGGSDMDEGRHGSYKEARGGFDMDEGRHGSHDKARGGFDMDEGRHGSHEEARGGSDMDVYKGRHGSHEEARGGSDMDVYKGRHGFHEEARGGSDMDEGRYASYKEAREGHLGHPCFADHDCASGSCDIRFGIAITTGTCECNTHRNQGCASGQKCLYNSMSANKCTTLKNLGHGCSRDDECKSGECDGVCECNSAKGGRDCPSGQTCQYNRSIPNACVAIKNRADGVDCDDDNQCRSKCCNSLSRVCYTTGWAEPCW